jgi:glycosyltransferase involved in cell wall biosynthesis
MWNDDAFGTMVKVLKREGVSTKTKLVLPSLFYSEQWNKNLGFKTFNIPHALSINRISTLLSHKQICHDYNLDKDKIKLLLPSRLDPDQKRPMLCLSACALLDEQIKRKVQIVMTGIDEQYVAELSTKAKLEKLDAVFNSFQHMSHAYAISGITVLPSRTESFGLSALESLSLGIPTALNNIPPYKEIAKGNDQAYFFDDTAEDLSHVLTYIIKNNKLRRRVPAAGWNVQYDPKAWAEKYIGLFRTNQRRE